MLTLALESLMMSAGFPIETIALSTRPASTRWRPVGTQDFELPAVVNKATRVTNAFIRGTSSARAISRTGSGQEGKITESIT